MPGFTRNPPKALGDPYLLFEQRDLDEMFKIKQNGSS